MYSSKLHSPNLSRIGTLAWGLVPIRYRLPVMRAALFAIDTKASLSLGLAGALEWRVDNAVQKPDGPARATHTDCYNR